MESDCQFFVTNLSEHFTLLFLCHIRLSLNIIEDPLDFMFKLCCVLVHYIPPVASVGTEFGYVYVLFL